MNAELSKMRRNMEAAVTEMNRHMENAETMKDPSRHEKVTATARHAVNTLKDLDEMENRRPYSDTKIGYGADARQSEGAYSNANEAMMAAVNAINKILPHLTGEAYESAMDAYDEAEMRRGVKGTGRSRKRVRVGGYTRRAEMDDDVYDDTRSEHERSTHEAVARAAAEAAAATARHMNANPRGANIYPATPVMPHHEMNAARYEANNNARGEATSEHTRSIGPGANL